MDHVVESSSLVHKVIRLRKTATATAAVVDQGLCFSSISESLLNLKLKQKIIIPHPRTEN